MVQTRGKRAAVSPPPAPEPEVKKQAKTKRGKKTAAAVEPITEDDDNDGIDRIADTPANADPSVADSPDGNDKAVDAQVAVNSLAIPVDDHCPLSNYRVHIDPESKVIFDAALNQVFDYEKMS